MKQYLFVILAVTMFAACSGNNQSNQSSETSEEVLDAKEHPFFGNILNIYGEAVRDGKSSKEIKREIKDVIREAKGRELPVKGSPYGIKTSKAVITDWNVQTDKLNIILKFIPDEGTDFKILMDPTNGILMKKYVNCNMMMSYGRIIDRLAHRPVNTNNLELTLNIYSSGLPNYNSWKGLEYIELTESK